MKKIESFKRLIILWLSMVGVFLQVGIYAYAWFQVYYPLVLRGYQRDVGIKLGAFGLFRVANEVRSVPSILRISQPSNSAKQSKNGEF